MMFLSNALQVFCSIWVVFFLFGCSHTHTHTHTQPLRVSEFAAADNIELQTLGGDSLQPTVLETSSFYFQVFLPTHTPNREALAASNALSTSVLWVYLEGDGLAWQSRESISPDPTPITATSLDLAKAHIKSSADNVVYLARPCQFVRAQHQRNCLPQYWTGARYSAAVVEATSQALDQLKQQYQAQQLVLVGYSGGGTLAALSAIRRDDVRALVTVAANLDHRSWTQWHGVSSLDDSLTVTDHLALLAQIPQWHLLGENDHMVPPALTENLVRSFKKHAVDSHNIQLQTWPETDHTCCWPIRWPEFIQQYAAMIEGTSSPQ